MSSSNRIISERRISPRKGTHLEAALRVHLTDKFCSTAKAKGQADFFDDKVHGLALRVSPTAKSWTLIYSRPGGKRARMTLGRYPVLSLAAARARALEAKGAIAEGRPLAAVGTLRSVVDDYFRREGASLRSVNARRSVFDRWAARPAQAAPTVPFKGTLACAWVQLATAATDCLQHSIH
jgi:hypothetical protein